MCMIEYADDAYTLYNGPTIVRGRKDYRCQECGRSIPKGEAHYTASGLFEGQWERTRMCAHCHVGANWLQENCSGFMHSMVREDIHEHVVEYRRTATCVPRLKRIEIGMSRKWLIRHGPRKGQLMPLPQLPAKLEPTHHH